MENGKRRKEKGEKGIKILCYQFVFIFKLYLHTFSHTYTHFDMLNF